MYVISRVFEDSELNASRLIVKTGYASYEAAKHKVAELLANDIVKYVRSGVLANLYSAYNQLVIGNGEITVTYDICEVKLEA